MIQTLFLRQVMKSLWVRQVKRKMNGKKEKNVQIPESLFEDIIDFLVFRVKPGEPLQEKHHEQLNRIVDALSRKQDKLICHKAYSVMATTKNADEYERAKFNYHYYRGD